MLWFLNAAIKENKAFILFYFIAGLGSCASCAARLSQYLVYFIAYQSSPAIKENKCFVFYCSIFYVIAHETTPLYGRACRMINHVC